MPEPQALVTAEQLAGDPHPVLRRLRETAPVAWAPGQVPRPPRRAWSSASPPSFASGGTRQDETVRVVVLSDTHAPRRWKTCPPAVAARLRGADLILHAGDVCTAAVLDELAAYAPVRAVAGNNDGPDVTAWGAPETLELDIAGLPAAMIHDSGSRQGRMARLRTRFPAARLIVFGHSHIPWNETEDGVRAFNPGSPTDRRRAPQGTIGLLRIEDGQVIDAHVIPVT